jgi:hypothetical protein
VALVSKELNQIFNSEAINVRSTSVLDLGALYELVICKIGAVLGAKLTGFLPCQMSTSQAIEV